MNEKKYAQFMSTVKAPDSAVEKAVVGIYNSDTSTTVREYKPRPRGYFGVAATAAVLCLVILAGVMFYPFGTGADNSFVINAGAAEINSYELTKLGELKCEFNSIGVAIDEDNQATAITMCEWLDFPITCTGENIEAVTYKVQGKGFFAISDTAEIVYDKEYFEESAEIAPYDKIHLTGNNGVHNYGEKLISYTADYLFQNQGVLLCLYISEDNGKYCQMYNSTAFDTDNGTALGKDFDYQQMYYELFSAGDYTIEITARFNDGTTQTKTVDLIIEKTDKADYAEKSSTLTISARLAE